MTPSPFRDPITLAVPTALSASVCPRLPSSHRSAPTLYPRWQRSNHVQVCTPVCSLADGCFQYPWVDVTVVIHWWISGSWWWFWFMMIVHDDCSWWLFMMIVLQVFRWVAEGLAMLNCWNNVMVDHHCHGWSSLSWLIIIVKKKYFYDFFRFLYEWLMFLKCTLFIGIHWSIFKIKYP